MNIGFLGEKWFWLNCIIISTIAEPEQQQQQQQQPSNSQDRDYGSRLKIQLIGHHASTVNSFIIRIISFSASDTRKEHLNNHGQTYEKHLKNHGKREQSLKTWQILSQSLTKNIRVNPDELSIL